MTGPHRQDVTTPISASGLVIPVWRRARLWLVLATLVVAAGFVAAANQPAPGLGLDPSSPSHGGSKALAVVLGEHGTAVRRVTSLQAVHPGIPVVVPYPDSYAPNQLRELVAAGDRLVLIEPSGPLVAAVDPRLTLSGSDDSPATADPGCAVPGAIASGRIQWTAGTQRYQSRDHSLPGCYGGRAILGGDIVVLGSSDPLRNASLAQPGYAALAVNAISVDSSGQVSSAVTWLMPGPDAAGGTAAARTPTIWSVFPPGSGRIAAWLLIIGLLLALWRGRRMGPVVSEPLPVVVRSAEIVEGHGRLYAAAGARDRAAAALRAGTRRRLAQRLGLPRNASVDELVAMQSTRWGASTGVAALLAGPAPDTDADLVRLAGELDELERHPKQSSQREEPPREHTD